MIITKTIPIDLAARGPAMQIGETAVAGDCGSRALVFELMEEGRPWTVPQGVHAALAFRTESGCEGEYDTLPDGSDAAVMEGNRVTVRLLEGMLREPGAVWLSVILRDLAMGQLSSFPVLLKVSRGLTDGAPLPERYYRVRNLEEVNQALWDLSDRVDLVDTEESRAAVREARAAAEAAKAYAAAVDTDAINRQIAQKGDDVYIQDGKLWLTSNGKTIGTGTALPESDGVGFDSWAYDQGTKLLHLYDSDGNDVLEPVYIPGGAGATDTGSRLTVAMKTASAVVAAECDEEIWLEFRFSSVDSITQVSTGAGTMELSVDGTVKRTAQLQQGNCRVNLRPYLAAGANAVVLTVTDAYGSSAVRRLTVTLETLELSWSLGATQKTEDTLTVQLTPVGNYVKTVHLAVDGTELETFEVSTSGRRVTKTIPIQSHGGHRITAWAEMEAGGTVMTSQVLECACAWVTEDSPVIACSGVPEEADQFSTVTLLHRVIDPVHNPTVVQYLVNGMVFKEAQVDQNQQTWTYRLSTAENTVLTILCGEARYDVLIRVNAIGADVQEVLDGLVLKVDPAAMADLESWNVNGHRFTLSQGFDLVNGGLQNDEDGVRCIRVTAGDRLTLDYPMFARDARGKGMAAKIIYAVRSPSAKHCTAISCLQDDMGLQIQANNVYLRGNQTECKLSTCEDEKVELDVGIQPDSGDGIMLLWERCSTFAYRKYAPDESFTHTEAPGITIGCDDADVYLYLMRFYDRDLTDNERLANFAYDGKDTAQIRSRQDRSDIYDSTGSIDIEKCAAKNPDCHHIIISAPRMTRGKSDEVRGTIRHIYRGGGPEHQWSAPVSMFVQGTSSVEHAETAGPNINFYYPGGITLEDGTQVTDGYAMNGRDKSMPVLELTYKKNIASEDHIVNRATAEWYNRFQPSVRPERIANPLVRDCLDSCMCAVYFHNTGSDAVQVGPDLVPPGATIFFGLGNLCSNKDSVHAFAYHPIVIEVKNNTEPQVRFKSDDLTGDNWKNNYEFRYLDLAQFSEEQAKAQWQRVQTFLYQTDCFSATDGALPEAAVIGGVTYTHDTVDYRRARWLEESPVIFDKKTLTWHHNVTLFLLLRDNRAKNMFWSYDPTSKKWGLWFNWDNDTGLCRNNDGYVDIEPGYMDFDRLGTGDVFNGADNVVFANLREWEFDALKTDYLERESAGSWDADAFYSYAMDSQEAICEALWVEDAAHNAIRTMQNLGTSAYLERATGRLRLHIKKALTFQRVLVDSYYCSAAATGQSAAFRGYTPAQWAGVAPDGKVAVTAYTNLYVNILAGSTAYRVRATEGIPLELDLSASLNNTELYFRHAPWIQDLGDLSGLYLGQFEASSLKRVRRLLIGSENPEYYNTNFTQASFDNCVKLETLNLGGLKNATRSFDFRPNLYLKELYTRGSGVTGVTFAKQGRLASARLNAVRSLSVDSLTKLETLTMPTYGNLNVLSVSNTPALNTLEMAAGASQLQRVRLIGIDWSCETADTLMHLSECAGRDDEGRDIPEPIVTGCVDIAALTQEELDHLHRVFPELQITYGAIVPSYTVRFLVDGQVCNTQRVAHDAMAKDPVKAGYMDTPTKASDVEYHYSYTGWDRSLQNITADTDINAVFAARDRYYTVRYWYDAAENTLAQETTVPAHGSCVFTAAEPEVDSDYWIGWDGETADVVSDLNLHPKFLVPELPDTVVEQFDYLYSDDPDDDSAYTLAQLAGILDTGRAREYFQPGDRIRMLIPENDTFTDREIVMMVLGFNHYPMADGSGFSGVVFGMTGLMDSGYWIASSRVNSGGWPASDMRTYLNETIFPALPLHWQVLIRSVTVRSSVGDQSAEIVSAQDRLFLLSFAELFSTGDAAVEPYINEVDPEAENCTFPVFTDNASRIRSYYNGGGSAGVYWTRSPWARVNTNNAQIEANGDHYPKTASGGMAAFVHSSNGICWACSMGVACV